MNIDCLALKCLRLLISYRIVSSTLRKCLKCNQRRIIFLPRCSVAQQLLYALYS